MMTLMNKALAAVVRGPYEPFLRSHAFIREPMVNADAEIQPDTVCFASPEFRVRFVFDRGDVLTYLAPLRSNDYCDLGYVISYVEESEDLIPANHHQQEVDALERNYQELTTLFMDPGTSTWKHAKQCIHEHGHRVMQKLMAEARSQRPWWKFW